MRHAVGVVYLVAAAQDLSQQAAGQELRLGQLLALARVGLRLEADAEEALVQADEDAAAVRPDGVAGVEDPNSARW